MFKLSGTIAVFSFVVTFVSCQKQSELQPPTDLNQEHHGLWRVRITNPAQTGMVYIWEFKFDGSSRVTDLLSYTVDSNTTGRPDTTNEEHTAYFYKGTDTLPYKSTAPKSATGVGTTIYYTYDGQGRKILDSNESKNTADIYFWDKVFYNYSNNKIVVTEAGKSPFVGPRNYADTIYTSAQNNISKIVHREEWPGKPAFTHLFSYAYDDKKNPFYDLNIRGVTFFDGQVFSYQNMYFGFNRNNQTEQLLIDDPTKPPSKTIITHTYNKDGYPLISVFDSYYGQPTVSYTEIHSYDYK